MTTVWLLLLVLVASSQSVDSQSTTDDEVYDCAMLRELRRDMQTLFQSVMNRLGKS